MLMQNTAPHTIYLPTNLAANCQNKPAEDKPSWAVPPGGIIDVSNAYACRSRSMHGIGSNPQTRPSIAERLSGGALRPYGRAANEMYKLFCDELPEIIAEVARHRHSESGVAARVDAKAEGARREAEEVGRATLRALGRLHAEAQQAEQPPVYSAEDLPDV